MTQFLPIWPRPWRRSPVAGRAAACVLAWAALPISLQAQATEAAIQPATPWRTALSGGVRVHTAKVDDGIQVQLWAGRVRGTQVIPLPDETWTGSVRDVALAGGARAVLVDLQSTEGAGTALFVIVRGRVSAAWAGRTDPRGDLGERRRVQVLVEDKTGDGIDDVIVAHTIEGRAICGQSQTLLSPRAIDPRSGRLRPVQLRRLPEIEDEVEVAAAPQPPAELRTEDGGARPSLVDGLLPVAASSVWGLEDSQHATPTALTDGRPETSWVEGHGGNGRFEYATLRWNARGFAIRAFALTPTQLEGAGAPQTLWLVGDAGRIRVRLPASSRSAGAAPNQAGRPFWVVPPEPLHWGCVSVVLDAPTGNATRVGLAEIRAYSDLDFGGGVESLVARLGRGGSEAEVAARLLGNLGADAANALRDQWPRFGDTEKRNATRALAVLAATEPTALGLLEQAARDDEETIREPALLALLNLGEDAYGALGRLTEEDSVSDHAAVAFARHAPRAAVPAVLSALMAEGGASRPALREALRTAAQRGDDGARNAIREWLESETTPIEALAGAALALATGGEVLQPLAALAVQRGLAASAFADRWRIAKAAALLPASEAVDAWLARLAADAEEWMLRAQAIDALRRREASRSILVARQSLEDEYPRVRLAAVKALRGRADDVVRVATVARRDGWPMVRSAAVRGLAGSRRALPVVRATLTDRSQSVRAAAVEVLEEAEDWQSWAAIEARLTDDNEWPEVLEAAVSFARRRCRADAIPALETAFERAFKPTPWDPDVRVAAAALEAAMAIDPARAQPLLERASQSSAPGGLRVAANLAPQRQNRCAAAQ